jgi:hypothetical protein
VQEREIARAIWSMSLPPRLSFVSIATDLKCVALVQQCRITLLDGDSEDVPRAIDLRAATDSQTFGSQYVVVRNDGLRGSTDTWVLAGHLIYIYENIEGDGSVIGVEQTYGLVGVAVGSQMNLVFTTEAIMKAAGGGLRRVIPVHQRRLVDEFPSRERERGLRVSEICRASDESSRLSVECLEIAQVPGDRGFDFRDWYRLSRADRLRIRAAPQAPRQRDRERESLKSRNSRRYFREIEIAYPERCENPTIGVCVTSSRWKCRQSGTEAMAFVVTSASGRVGYTEPFDESAFSDAI